MAHQNQTGTIEEPVLAFETALDNAWHSLCQKYDVSACLPGVSELLRDADLSLPAQAAEFVLAGMLGEIMENVSRFSPWYRMPARGYGLMVVRDTTANRLRQILTPDARQTHQALLAELTAAIRANSAVIEAILLVDGLMGPAAEDDPCITVSCGCVPPRMIRIRQSIFEQARIQCEACAREFGG